MRNRERREIRIINPDDYLLFLRFAGLLAQLVQSAALTEQRSLVRTQYSPLLLILQLHYLHNSLKNLSRYTTFSSMNPKELKFYLEIDEIIYSDWNPIGIKNLPRDEYQSYTHQIFALKYKGSNIETIAQAEILL